MLRIQTALQVYTVYEKYNMATPVCDSIELCTHHVPVCWLAVSLFVTPPGPCAVQPTDPEQKWYLQHTPSNTCMCIYMYMYMYMLN